MKYKRIKSFLHNFGHSFFSFTNYVDGGFIVDEIPDYLKGCDLKELRIHFPEGNVENGVVLSKRFRKSIGYWADSMDKHAKSENVELSRLHGVVLVARLSQLGITYHVEAQDDRGKIYDIPI